MSDKPGASGLTKFLIGCGIFAVVIIVVVCGIGGFLAYKGGKAIQEITKSIEKTNQNYASAETKYPFAEPGDNSLTEAQLVKYFAVRKRMRENVAQRPFIKKITEAAAGTKPDLGLKDMISIGKFIAVDIHAEMHNELVAQQMSPGEYGYILRTSYLTLRKGAAESEAFKQALANLGSGLKNVEKSLEGIDLSAGGAGASGQAGTAINSDLEGFLRQLDNGAILPEENVTLLAKHLDEFKAEGIMVFFDIIIYSWFQENESNWRRISRSAEKTATP